MGSILMTVHFAGKKGENKIQNLAVNERSGLGLPSLWDDCVAAQLRPLKCLCSLTYKVGWKERENSSKRNTNNDYADRRKTTGSIDRTL